MLPEMSPSLTHLFLFTNLTVWYLAQMQSYSICILEKTYLGWMFLNEKPAFFFHLVTMYLWYVLCPKRHTCENRSSMHQCILLNLLFPDNSIYENHSFVTYSKTKLKADNFPKLIFRWIENMTIHGIKIVLKSKPYSHIKLIHFKSYA